jgi:hypothetical protein
MMPVLGLGLGGMTARGWSVTGIAYPYSFVPLAGDLGDLVLTSQAATGTTRPPGGPAVTLMGRTPLFAARLAQDSATADVPRGAHEVTGR